MIFARIPGIQLMSHQIKPSTAKNLFQLAHTIRQNEPWKDLSDNDWFGICNPDSGDIHIVAVMGMAQQVYAIQLYLPEEGIRFWNNILATYEVNEQQAIHDQRMIECEFCDEEDLPEEDLEFHATYGLPHGENHSLPVFRSCRPNYYPWFLDENEASLIQHALVLTTKFHREFLNKLHSYYEPTKPHGLPEIPVFYLNKGADPMDAGQWESQRKPFPLAPEKPLPEIPTDDLFLNRFKKLPKKNVHWEIGCFYLPAPMKEEEDERPYYPVLSLCIDAASNVPPHPEISHPEKGLPMALRKAFSDAADSYGYLPSELHVASPTATLTFEDLEEAYGIKVIQSENLPHLSQLAPLLIAAMSGEIPSQALAELVGENFDPANTDFKMPGDLTELLEDPSLDLEIPPYSPPTSTTRYVMRVDLQDAKPPIWRRITIPIDATFFDLHCAIQDAMGWEDCNLHGFEIGPSQHRILIQADLEDEDLGQFGQNLNEYTTHLQKVLQEDHPKFTYTYDFGDRWVHKIKIEKTMETDIANPLPTILKGKRACPPEDCGGIWVYRKLMKGNDKELLDDYCQEELESIRNEVFDIDDVEFGDPSERMGIGFW